MQGRQPPEMPFPDLMTPAEVAAAFRVDPKSVVRWDKKGLIDSVRTPGGHRRYVAASVKQYLRATTKGGQR